jgi:hypothetical protein
MDGRARACNQVVDHRAQFERAVELQNLPLKVGDWVLSHGNLCQLTSIGEDDPSSYAEEGPSCGLSYPCGHYCMRKYSCLCKACSLVHGRGCSSAVNSLHNCTHGCVSRGNLLDVTGCLRSKLTVWKEDKFTVLPGQGIKQREKRVAE